MKTVAKGKDRDMGWKQLLREMIGMEMVARGKDTQCSWVFKPT